MELILSSIKQKSIKYHIFNSYFYSFLSDEERGYNYQKVKGYSKKIDLFSFNKILIPLHLVNHWCLAIINFEEKKIEYYDSLKGNNYTCFKVLKTYLSDERKNKNNSEYDLSDWTEYSPKNIPEQRNGYDCGVFMCQFAKHLAFGKLLSFEQRDMSLLRRQMILEIMNCSLNIKL